MSDLLESDRRVAKVIESSAVFGVIDRLTGLAWRAACGSVVLANVARLATAWSLLGASLRRLAVGTTLVVAAATHLIFTVVTQTPPGWLWLIVPGLVAGTGVLVLAASRQARD